MSLAKTNKVWDLVVVGGGAAGVFAAIRYGEAWLESQPKTRPPRILLLEAGPKLLAKVKISGGGRCNVTHYCLDPKFLLTHYPRSHRKLEGAFRQFGPKDTINWFQSRGVTLKTEADGRMFPTTDDSQTIIDCLAQQLQKFKVTILTQCPVTRCDTTKDGFQLHTKEGAPVNTRQLVLATGGSRRGHSLVEQLGHTLVSPIPSLFTFELEKTSPYLALAGVSVPKVTLTCQWPAGLKVDGKTAKPMTQTGPLLFTHWGISGPAVLKLSAWGARGLAAVNYQAKLLVDWLPDDTEEGIRQQLITLKSSAAARQLGNEPLPGIPKRLWQVLLTEHGLAVTSVWRDCPNKPLNQLASKLNAWPLMMTGKGPFKEEFVTAGGVALADINLATFTSKRQPNMGLVGELLNVDGVTGGFNFQHAWTSGYLAGQALAHQGLTGTDH